MSRRQERHVRFAAEKVREHRARLGMTNEELAREVGATLRTVQRWQSGSNEPTAIQALRLAAALEIEIGELYLAEAPAA